MADDDEAAADVEQHGRADLAGEGPFGLAVAVLGAEQHRRAAQGLPHDAEVRERRADGDAAARLAAEPFDDGLGQRPRRRRVGVHLPVADHPLLARHGGFPQKSEVRGQRSEVRKEKPLLALRARRSSSDF